MGGVAWIAALIVAGWVCASAQAKPGDLYVGDPGTSTIWRIDPDNGHHHLVASGGDLDSPDSGAFTANGKLLIADYQTFANVGAIFKVDPNTGDVSLVVTDPSFHGPTDVAIGPGGHVYAVDPNMGTGSLGAVLDIDVPGNGFDIFSQGQLFERGPLGISVLPSGRILTSSSQNLLKADGALIKVNQDTAAQSFVSHGGHLVDPYGMTLSANAKKAYIADFAGRIVQVKLASGDQRVIAKGKHLDEVTDVALGLDGALYATNDSSTDPGITRVNPKTGKKHVVSAGGFLGAPEGITVEPK